MDIEIKEESMRELAEHARIPIAYEVSRSVEVREKGDGAGGFILTERKVHPPYTKDYDAVESPAEWPARFDMAGWGLIAARVEGCRVGGAVVVFDTPDFDMLAGRNDLATVWDLRVSPEVRRHGIGRALFRSAEAWAAARGCTQLKVETQNTNVPACRFYAGEGCVLQAVARFAYPELPEEIQLIWCKELSRHEA